MITVIDFINNVLGLPERFNFISFVVAGALVLILLDGIISFLFAGFSSLTSKK